MELTFNSNMFGTMPEIFLNERKIGQLEYHIQLAEYIFSGFYEYLNYLTKRTYKSVDDFKTYFQHTSHILLNQLEELNKQVVTYKEIEFELASFNKVGGISYIDRIVNLKDFCSYNSNILVDVLVKKFPNHCEVQCDMRLVKVDLNSSWVNIGKEYCDESKYAIVVKKESNRNFFTKVYATWIGAEINNLYRKEDILIFRKESGFSKNYEKICIKYLDF